MVLQGGDVEKCNSCISDNWRGERLCVCVFVYLCICVFVYLYAYILKVGDAGDISPPIFWIFRQILG